MASNASEVHSEILERCKDKAVYGGIRLDHERFV
jgi:hypothetical protein